MKLIPAIILALSFTLNSSCFAAKAWVPNYQKSGMEKIHSQNQKGKTISEKVSSNDVDENKAIIKEFMKKDKSKKHMTALKARVIKMANKAVPTLIKVMKSDKFPEHKRWTATFYLGQVMGDKAAAFIAKFASHKNWVMRLASLKTLMAMKNTKFIGVYNNALKDKSLIIRNQTIDIIRELKITKLAPSVWSMLYDKKNYNGKKDSKQKRTEIISKVIRTLGDLNFKKVKAPLLKMASNKKFEDVFKDLDYSLQKLVGKSSPDGSVSKKRHFWKRYQLATSKI